MTGEASKNEIDTKAQNKMLEVRNSSPLKFSYFISATCYYEDETSCTSEVECRKTKPIKTMKDVELLKSSLYVDFQKQRISKIEKIIITGIYPLEGK